MEDTKPTSDQTLDTTTVGQVDVNLDELFGTPGAENIMLPENKEAEEKPKSVFSNENLVDVSFIDKTATGTNETVASKEEAKQEAKDKNPQS